MQQCCTELPQTLVGSGPIVWAAILAALAVAANYVERKVKK